MLGKKTLLSVIFVVAFAYYLSLPKKIREGKVIETDSGAVRGIISVSRDGREFYEWLGIPYAKPPVGDLRFASPVPIEKWTGIHDGSQHGNKCVQNNVMFTGSYDGYEDCLFLNVHVPKDTKKILPVMVYVHGGAFLLGSSSDYGPHYLMDEDIILVTINYRVNILGFLSTGDKVIRGNMGLKDQVQALKWIKQNIYHFGGDPNKITIFGHSAGGASISHLVLSPMAKGLFNKAISHSGVASNTWGFKRPEKSLKKTKSVAQALGCPTENSEEIAKCLRSVSVSDLMKTVSHDVSDLPLFKPHRFADPVVPTIELVDDDDSFLTEHPLKIIAQGKANRVPWMIGHTSHEGSMCTFPLKDKKIMQEFEENWEECLKSVFSIDSSVNSSANEKAAKIRDFYLPPSQRSSLTQEDKMEIYTNLFGDGFFNFDLREFIFYQRQFSPVYPYFYSKTNGPSYMPVVEILSSESWTRTFDLIFFLLKFIVNTSLQRELPEDGPVASHATDMNVLFSIFPVPTTSKHYKFSKEYIKFVVDFAVADDVSTVKFRDVNLAVASKTGPLKFIEISDDKTKIINEPFQERMEFLRELKIRDLSL